MHPCLDIPEIFRRICDEIRLRTTPPHPQSDLASLARTCRALSEIALDSLWYEIDGIGPLIRCMPRDLWEIDGDRRLFLRRPLKSSDIHIFNKYAQHVRSFQSHYSPWHDLPYRALPSYFCGRGSDRLLPKLEQLAWHVDNAEVFPHLGIFLSSALKTLSITFDVRHREQLSCLGTIPTYSPNISKLTIGLSHHTTFSFNNSLVEGFSDALQAWHNLSELEIFYAPLDGLLCAAQMPKLKRLSIHLAKISERSLSDLPNFPWDPPCPSQHYFPALKSLALSSIPSLTVATQFFKMLRSTKLSSLKLGFTAPNTLPDHFHTFFSILTEHCNPSSLRVFQFACWHP
ncbi:hypothetical protein P691DRAFT_800453 [Macrolepiota fuliginosa MF-IS2]|uniref:F-box domain-containing protein n=1 Tax=Macrolepiota fuliginosa MF-IS2 TaxID=1400762 RepID=A0A9P5XFR1_9AGAR|nr:hypothetical protein P691DRAFT_800453 [Macrolepiota fuliginosa MF-IS2]